MADHSPYSLVDIAPKAPGACWASKSPTGPMIDTGIDILWNERGRMYLSVEVLREMAQIAGLFDDIDEKTAAAYADGQEAGKKEDLSGNLDRGIAQLGLIVDSLRSLVVDPPVPAAADEPAAGADDPVVDTGKSKPARAGRGTRQGHGPAVQSRPDDVPAAPVHEQFVV